MNERNKKIELLGSAPIPKALLAMGLPIMIGMMINALYNLVDAYFVGGLGTSQMGSISVAFPLGQAVVGLGLLFGNGASSYISRLLGHGDKETANKVASTALYSSIFVGAVIIICTIIFLNPILKLLGATESILPYAITYTRIYVISSIFNVFNVTMNNIVTSEGAAKTTMCALLTGAILNIILDPIFIYVLDLGVAGAAIATAISQVVSTLVYLGYVLRKKSVFSFSIKECCFSKEIMSEILKIGIPTLIFQLLTSLSITLINMQAKGYGDSVIAGIGAVTRIISMGSLMVFGFIKGFQPIAGYSYGAKKYERLYEAIRTSIKWSTIFCAIFGLIMALFPTTIISQFTTGDMELINIGQNALRANGLSFFLFGYYTVYSSLFLSLGKAKKGFILGACRQGICFIPVILVVPMIWGINGILYAQPISDVISTIITVFMAVHLHKELNAIKSDSISTIDERHSSTLN
ncbi:MATE family efflux transporter [Clostridium sporogenes]|uniref:MATE family efflux transporter n=1 Tax=Clostridium sporogenes TaxID=1509 RepID=UPI0013D81039|nr:MATE family efflux transporter [Clostridium sporogenes]NFF66234.1 MATE family efflux transporter [Clostridium sporogenes]NFF97219.1 MATE family efflux transporter [Clostridium sporogenes]NFG04755.1 MATE family efflux transporter [Clostridium sporogenes]NFG50724.1 MATE family efflux transporter [Clostridium sporogenes]NFP83646.1 MATE family efflux transporter [Clostridium sporogenes]